MPINFSFFPEYCKKIIKNFAAQTPNKIMWIPSIYEIECRLQNKPIKLKVHFGKSRSEHFVINERTTVTDLFDIITNESSIFKGISERRLYWLYVKHLNISENVPAFNEE